MNYKVILSYLKKKAVGQDYLYHFTTLGALSQILGQNTLGFKNQKDIRPEKAVLNDPNIVSLTRGNLADIFRDMPVRLVLDKAKLRTTYKMKPYADPHVRVRKLEKEEQLFGPLTNLDKYLVRIDLKKENYDKLKEEDTKKAHRRESLEQALEILNQSPDIETALKDTKENKTLEYWKQFKETDDSITKERAVKSIQTTLPLYAKTNPLLKHPKLNVVADLNTPLYKLK